MARVAFFAFDINEAAQLRRIRSVRSLGHDVVSLSFRRRNMTPERPVDWRDVDLGTVENERYIKRLVAVLQAAWRAYRARAELSGASVWIARNLDMLLIAWFVRAATRRSDVSLVYECLDIHGLMTRPDAVGRAMRWAERRLLGRTSLLIVSSPGFMRAFFEPVQGYRGPVALLENKLWFDGAPVPRPRRPRRANGPLVIGWVGSLRCATSLAILAETAEQLGPQVRFELHGNVHSHAVPEFSDVVARLPNVNYHGPYRYPDDLHGIYTSCDLVWAQDLWQAGSNSDWLLPNRIYEAGYFGCPSIALAGVETGRRVAEQGLGFVLQEASSTALVGLVNSLSRQDIDDASAHLLALDERAFRLSPTDLAEALAPVLPRLDQEALATPPKGRHSHAA